MEKSFAPVDQKEQWPRGPAGQVKPFCSLFLEHLCDCGVAITDADHKPVRLIWPNKKTEAPQAVRRRLRMVSAGGKSGR